jgi:hypothetical protein
VRGPDAVARADDLAVVVVVDLLADDLGAHAVSVRELLKRGALGERAPFLAGTDVLNVVGGEERVRDLLVELHGRLRLLRAGRLHGEP